MYLNPLDRASSPTRSAWRVLVAACVAVVFASHALAQAPAVGGGAAPPMSTEELDNLVGPVALYPDDLVAIILPAATNPLQLVQADRFLDKRKTDPKLPVDEKWDDAVKSLLNYPDVVKTMSGDLDWTAALGEAVVADQGAVLEAIQVFRRRAQAVGNLKTDTKQIVEVEKEVIRIVPANPEVIYVPQYNPTTIVVAGGYPTWGYWPTPYPVYYYPYPPGAAFATGLIWGAAIGAAWNGGHWNTNWGGGGNNNININRNTNINTGNINRPGGATTRPAQGGGSAWKSDKRPGQVSNTVGRTAPTARVGDTRPGGAGSAGAGARPSTQPAGGGAGQGAAASNRAGSAGASQRAGSVSASPRDSFGGASAGRGAGAGGNAMSGYGSGRQTQMDSSRGAASRGSASGGASRSMSSGGGGGRGGGGGGGGRGGGGRR